MRAIAHGGAAVVVTERGVVLAPGAAPGERVRLEDVAREGKVLRGRVAEILERSPARVTPACSLAMRCGGCPLMHLDAGAQALAKLVLVRDALGASATCLDAEIVAAPRVLAYRRRARLAWKRLRGTTVLGYRARRAHDIVDVAHCPVLEPVLDRALATFRERLAPILAGDGQLALAIGAGGLATLVVVTDAAQSAEVYRVAAALVSEALTAGIVLDIGGSRALFGDPRERSLAVDGRELVGPPAGFSQAHEGVNEALVRRVVELAETSGARVLELYSGHGNLTVALAPGAESLVAVEQDRAAAEACAENLRARELAHARVVSGDAAAHAGGQRLDVVVLDPPRDGALATLDGIVARRPARIVYVSCDTATLGRDLGELGKRGYRVDAATAFDMFPQTAHVETVVRLVRT